MGTLIPWEIPVFRMGIDPGYNHCAIVVMRPDGIVEDWNVLHCVRPKTKAPYRIEINSLGGRELLESPQDLWERIHAVVEEVIKIVIKYHPVAVCLEDYAYSAQGMYQSSSTITLGEFGGALKERLTLLGTSFIVVTTQQLRKLLTGSGAAKKENVIATAKEYMSIEEPFRLKKNAEHIAFAFACSYYLHWMGIEKKLTHEKYRCPVLD